MLLLKYTKSYLEVLYFLYLFVCNYLAIHIQNTYKLVLVYTALFQRKILNIVWKHFQDVSL